MQLAVVMSYGNISKKQQVKYGEVLRLSQHAKQTPEGIQIFRGVDSTMSSRAS